jgi:ketoreductase RED1
VFPLFEVAWGERTGEDAVQAAVGFCSFAGRTPVDERKESPGS